MATKPKTPFNLMDMTSTASSFQTDDENDEQPRKVTGSLLDKPHTPIHKKLYRNALAYPYQFVFVMCLLGAYFCFGAAIGKFGGRNFPETRIARIAEYLSGMTPCYIYIHIYSYSLS